MPSRKNYSRSTDTMPHGRASAAALLHEIKRINAGVLAASHAVSRTEAALRVCLDKYSAAAPEQKREFVAVLADYLGQMMSGIAVDPEFYVSPDMNEALALIETRAGARGFTGAPSAHPTAEAP